MSGEEYTDGSPAADSYPWFVYQDTDTTARRFCQISPSGLAGRESRRVPELKNTEVLYCSPDGRWLLLFQREGVGRRVSIWNPATKESIELPLWSKPGFVRAVISCSPDDPNCLVFLFQGDSNLLAFCRVGDKRRRWRSFDYTKSIRAQSPGCNGWGYIHTCCCLFVPVSLKGKVYALTTCFDGLVEISVDASNICSTTVLKQNRAPPLHGFGYSYLVPWEDCHLYLIAVIFANCQDYKFCELPGFSVFIFDFSERQWYPVRSLKGGAIFLGASYSLASSASYSSAQWKWSFIYYYDACDHNQRFLSYRMEDGKVTSCASSKRPYQLSWPPCWIMPPQPEHNVDDDTSNGSNSKKAKVMENGSADVNCFNTMEPCLKKHKVMENAQGGFTRKKQKVVENGSIHFTSLCDLLPELIELIAEKVSSFVDYTYFLNINKLASDVPRRRKNKFRPCLIYRDAVESCYCIIDSNINRKVHVKTPEQVRGKSIGCCRDGWLLIKDDVPCYSCKWDGDRNSCYLFNPLTRQVIETLGFTGTNGGSGISNLTFVGGKPSPLSPEKSSVLAKSLLCLRQGSLLEPGAAAEAGKAVCWKLVVGEFRASCNSPVLVGEDWYYQGYDKSKNKLGRLRWPNMEKGKFEWKVEELKSPCKSYTRNYLIECGGELVSVYIYDEGKSWVRAFKIRDGVERKWEEIDSLRGYCLYLSSTSTISCVAETLDMADRIYFPKFYKDGLVYYSLKTKKYHSIGNEQDEVKRDQPITMFSDCAWIIPDCM